MNDGFFRHLDSEEIKSFRQWAKDNWTPDKAPDPCWHPVVREEWARLTEAFECREQCTTDHELIGECEECGSLGSQTCAPDCCTQRVKDDVGVGDHDTLDSSRLAYDEDNGA